MPAHAGAEAGPIPQVTVTPANSSVDLTGKYTMYVCAVRVFNALADRDRAS